MDKAEVDALLVGAVKALAELARSQHVESVWSARAVVIRVGPQSLLQQPPRSPRLYTSQWFWVWPPDMAENFIRFCFCLWLQNHTRTTFFLSSSLSAICAIFSPDGRGCTAKYASRERFSGAAMDVRFRFLSAALLKISGDFWFSLLWRSASSSHACRTGLRAIMLL